MLFFNLLTLILINVCHIYLFYFLIGKSKIPGYFVLFSGVIFSTILSLSLSLTGVVELNIVLISLLLLILGYINKTHRFIHILYFALLSIVLFTVVKNGAITIFYELYMDSPFNYYMWTSSLLVLCTLILLLIVMLLSKKYIHIAGSFLIQSALFWPSFIFVIICSVMLLIVNYPTIGVLANVNNLYGEQLYKLVALIAMLLLAVITFSMYVSKERLIAQHELSKQEQLLEYVEKLEFLHDELSTFRHDYGNLLLSLEQSIQENDLQQIKQIYEQTIAPTVHIMNDQQLELTKLANVEMPELKSILSVKVIAAQRKSFDVLLDIPQPFSNIQLSNDQLLRIITILLDNAIEEGQFSNEKRLLIALFEVDTVFYFVVQNSVDNQITQIDQLYDKGFSTKGQRRGIGLFSVQRIFSKHPNVTLLTALEEGLFTQTLMIKNHS